MEYSNELNHLKELQPTIINKNATGDDIQFVKSFYRSIFGKYPTIGCSVCIIESLFEILDFFKKNKHMAQFQLKTGVVLIDMANIDMTCNFKTITDEKAIYHLSRRPEKIKDFSFYPENWQDIVFGKVTETTTKTDENESDLSHKNNIDYESMTVAILKGELYKIGYIDSDFKDARGKFLKKAELIELLKKG